MERPRLKSTPSTNAPTKGKQGRFQKGNPGGPGNPFIKRVAMLRSALFAEVTVKDMRRVIRALISAATYGDVAAAKVLFDRVLGRVPGDVLGFIVQTEEATPNEVFL